jgi:hypothetical protein
VRFFLEQIMLGKFFLGHEILQIRFLGIHFS